MIKNLKEGLSPELISGRAKLEKIGEISYECIYQFIVTKWFKTPSLSWTRLQFVYQNNRSRIKI